MKKFTQEEWNDLIKQANDFASKNFTSVSFALRMLLVDNTSNRDDFLARHFPLNDERREEQFSKEISQKADSLLYFWLRARFGENYAQNSSFPSDRVELLKSAIARGLTVGMWEERWLNKTKVKQPDYKKEARAARQLFIAKNSMNPIKEQTLENIYVAICEENDKLLEKPEEAPNEH